MLARFTMIALASASAITVCNAQSIVLGDSAPPAAAMHTFSETCGGAHHYSLEISSTAAGERVSAHADANGSKINAPNLLGQIHGYDLYSVRMHCVTSGGLFLINVRKESGQFAEQTITVHDDGIALVGATRISKRIAKSG
ncbi:MULTISPECIES: hypothetical protein [unclassified Sphingomonas]|uniref:hypothetical protein n=1 Tax=unclassified Sphingomonas TaxID=196159 RepID=UPI00226A102F|nr:MULTISPECIES: hypothetical protein [unclassified Sphingomonas]